MFDVNDDMDNLFRRAAENYPLNTGGMNWDKVKAGLDETEQQQSTTPLKKTVGKKWLLLLMVLPVMWICTDYNLRQKERQIQETGVVSKKAIIAKNKPKETGGSSAAKQEVINSKLTRSRQPVVAKGNFSNHTTVAEQPIPLYSHPERLIVEGRRDEIVKDNSGKVEEDNEAVLADDPVALKPLNALDTQQQPANETDSVDAIDLPATTGDTVITKGTQKKQNDNNKRFYAGASVTLDVSTVKFQQTKVPGRGFGVLVGYNITSKLSVESGVSLQKKLYFSDAKYYNPKNRYSSPGYNLIDVDGECNMWEVPLNLRYVFSATTRRNWFVMAGSSSYFMKAENYTYTYDRYGQVSSMNVNYNKSSSALFSVLNFSVGYERKIGISSLIRIEPYFKTPLKGIGWGRLPITSSGLNIGYTKRLF